MKAETTTRTQLQQKFSLPVLKQDTGRTTNVTAGSARGMYCNIDNARSPENGSSASHFGRCRVRGVHCKFAKQASKLEWPRLQKGPVHFPLEDK